jgi:hypothetical protein
METFAKKSPFASVWTFIQGVIIFCMFFGGVLFIYYVDPLYYYKGVSLPSGLMFFSIPVVFLWLSYHCFKNAFKIGSLPTDIITADEQYLYLGSIAQKVEIKSVTSVFVALNENEWVKKNRFNKWFIKYGTIIVTTKDGGRYRQRFVDKAYDAAKKLNERIKIS